jgi:MFS-type transporter involved in bile tolerance (Atg22 family)
LIVPILATRFGWERALVGSAVLLGILYALIGLLLGNNLIGSPLVTAALLFGCGGPMIAVLLGLEGEAIAACAADQEPSAVAIYFGAYNLIVKALNGLALAMVGVMVEFGDAQALPLIAGGCLVAGVVAHAALAGPSRARPSV